MSLVFHVEDVCTLFKGIKKIYVKNILNNACDKTFGPRLFKNCLHKMAHMFDNNDDKTFIIRLFVSAPWIIFM